ncbi:hypothetical protein [Gallibacterium anatis]|uniref:hypothetical protein n=1 Tax=Gallibacterium anatis TaxID=750 RepID=UPI0039FCF081
MGTQTRKILLATSPLIQASCKGEGGILFRFVQKSIFIFSFFNNSQNLIKAPMGSL